MKLCSLNRILTTLELYDCMEYNALSTKEKLLINMNTYKSCEHVLTDSNVGARQLGQRHWFESQLSKVQSH